LPLDALVRASREAKKSSKKVTARAGDRAHVEPAGAMERNFTGNDSNFRAIKVLPRFSALDRGTRRGSGASHGRRTRGGNRGSSRVGFGVGSGQNIVNSGASRRPIVVRDPRDGSMRIVGEGRGTSNAPISRIINGYGGRRIVVRDPAACARSNGQAALCEPGNNVLSSSGIRGGYICKRGGSPRHRQSLLERNIGADGAAPKIVVENLDIGVNHSDIHELFSNIGPLDEAFVVYDDAGRHTGSAEVTFTNMDDALTAIKQYNNVPLDNRPLRISLSENSAPVRFSRPFRGRGRAHRRKGVRGRSTYGNSENACDVDSSVQARQSSTDQRM
jgi:hypothetical protein